MNEWEDYYFWCKQFRKKYNITRHQMLNLLQISEENKFVFCLSYPCIPDSIKVVINTNNSCGTLIAKIKILQEEIKTKDIENLIKERCISITSNLPKFLEENLREFNEFGILLIRGKNIVVSSRLNYTIEEVIDFMKKLPYYPYENSTLIVKKE